MDKRMEHDLQAVSTTLHGGTREDGALIGAFLTYAFEDPNQAGFTLHLLDDKVVIVFERSELQWALRLLDLVDDELLLDSYIRAAITCGGPADLASQFAAAAWFFSLGQPRSKELIAKWEGQLRADPDCRHWLWQE